MATATFSGQYGHNMTLEVWSGWNRPDTANNRSIVNVQARLRTNGYASMWGVTAPVTVTVDGKSESSNATVNIGTNSSLLFYGKDFVVPHNGDGTKTVGIKISVGLNAGGYGSSMVAFDLPLPTIARASTVNDVTGTLGSAMTININRKNSAFKHTVKYNFGSLSGTIATNVDTSVSWTPPLNLATAMPNKTSDWGNITVETYSGSSKIGSATCRLTLNVPDSVKPTLGSITLTDSNATVKNLLNTANTFAQVMSNIQVTFNNASGAYGSTISSYRAEIVGKNQSTNSNNGFLGMMNFNGTVTIRATVTDSRGRTSNAVDVKVTVINYFTPQISFTLQRSGSSSTTLTVTRNARIAPLTVGGKQKNKMIISFKYKEHSAANYTTDTGSAGGTWTTIDNLTNSRANLAATFSTLKTYDIIGKIEDAFTSYEFLATVGTEKFPVAIRPDRVGFGKTPENANAVDSDWVFKYKNKDIQHHQLSANDGTAIKLPDGTDLNTVTECGLYNGYSLLHGPTGTWANGWKYIRVSKHTHNNGYVLQEAIDFGGVISAFRVQEAGVWKDWQYYAVQNTVANFTTVNQTKVYSATIKGPYGMDLQARRVGNIVSVTLDATYKSTNSVSGVAVETIPSGWRPVKTEHIVSGMFAGGGSGTEMWTGKSLCHLVYLSNGSIKFTLRAAAQPVAVFASLTWITTDPFPAE
ncbi:DUF859 family phage minor structural protein [Streptococcus lutetiensis]|uniref:DUF859 family phage minor structural protein n=1 Tax=Streptococcus lutetiensis TaxID=150055 RepID=UPI003DA217AE